MCLDSGHPNIILVFFFLYYYLCGFVHSLMTSIFINFDQVCFISEELDLETAIQFGLFGNNLFT